MLIDLINEKQKELDDFQLNGYITPNSWFEKTCHLKAMAAMVDGIDIHSKEYDAIKLKLEQALIKLLRT